MFSNPVPRIPTGQDYLGTSLLSRGVRRERGEKEPIGQARPPIGADLERLELVLCWSVGFLGILAVLFFFLVLGLQNGVLCLLLAYV